MDSIHEADIVGGLGRGEGFHSVRYVQTGVGLVEKEAETTEPVPWKVGKGVGGFLQEWLGDTR